MAYQKTLYRLVDDCTINRILISTHKKTKYGSLRDKKCKSKYFRIGEKIYVISHLWMKIVGNYKTTEYLV